MVSLFYVDPYFVSRHALAQSQSTRFRSHWMHSLFTFGLYPSTLACVYVFAKGWLAPRCLFCSFFSFFAHVCKCPLFEVFVLLDADPYLLLRRTCASCLLLVCALATCLWCCCACFRLHLVRCIYSTLNSHLHSFSSHLGHL